MRSYDLSSYLKQPPRELNLSKAKERRPASLPAKSKRSTPWRRFLHNPSGLIGISLLAIIVVFCALGAVCSPYSYLGLDDTTGSVYSSCYPKILWNEGASFWNGRQNRSVNEREFAYYSLFDTERKPLVSSCKSGSLYNVDYDSYAVGARVIELTPDELSCYLRKESEGGSSIFLPLVEASPYLASYKQELLASPFNYSLSFIEETIKRMGDYYYQDANVTYQVLPLLEEDGSIMNNNVYMPRLDEKNEAIRLYAPPISFEGKEVYAASSNGNYRVRVDYEVFFKAKYGFSPHYLFGSNSRGADLFSRLCKGVLFSLALGISVSAVNLLLGIAYGAIEGYYGGKVDLAMERFSEIAGALPSVILLSIFNVLFNRATGLSSSARAIMGLFLAFIATGWLGIASTTRMQFYRYKNRDYVLASRSFGASDSRLIFAHILPNAIGTILTSSILMVPGVIYSESSLSYLGILDFSGSGLTSLGTLLNEGSAYLGTLNGSLLLFPSLFVCLLMIGFNMLGNGLRDAFNPRIGGKGL